MIRQSTANLVMVRPDHFGFNSQTAKTNPYQHSPQMMHKSAQEIRDAALFEFNSMVKKLRLGGVSVFILPGENGVISPDAIFPNNWFSHHQDGKLVLYPLLTPNRRFERQKEALIHLLEKAQTPISGIIDLTQDEEKGLILESTGSMVLDRVHKVAFAMASSRTNKEEFEKWCEIMSYRGIFIPTPRNHVKEVYHTNICMSIGTDFVVICLDVLADENEKRILRKEINDLGKECIEITFDQMYAFCGNILELRSKDNQKLLAMSETARNAFTTQQLTHLERYCKIVPFASPTIEEVGGGGVRCMIAEIFS